MSCDRVIRWKPGNKNRPTKEEIQHVLEDFFSGAALVNWDKDRFFVKLTGSPSFALKRIEGCLVRIQHHDERWIEVWPGKDSLFVMTRMQDDFTNSLAESVASIFARWWKGTLEQ